MKKGLKLTGVLTVAAMLLSSMPLPSMADNGAQLVKQWGFETDAQGWQIGANSMENFKVTDGTIRADAIIGNEDPRFVSADLLNEDITLGNGTDGKPNYVKIRMKNHTDIADEGKVFFMTEGDVDYSSEKSCTFSINKNQSDFVDIYLKMSNVDGWAGKLKALRIDPADKYGMDTTKGGTFIIDEVSLYAIPEPEIKTVVNQTFDTQYTKEVTGHDWWASYLKDQNGKLMVRAAVSATEINQADEALNIKFTTANQRVDVLGFAGDKDTTGVHKVSVRIKNNGPSAATVHLNAVGAVDEDGKEYALLMNQSIASGTEKTITFERDFYQPTTEENAILIQSANACDITVDDVKLVKEDKLALSPLSQIHEGATDVDIAGAYGLLFNYDVKGGHSQYTHLGLNESGQANIKIYEEGQSTAAVNVSYAVGSSTYAQFCIPSTSALKYNTNYTLKLDIVNTKDNSQSLKDLQVNFKTKEEPKMMGIDSAGVETTVLTQTDKIKYSGISVGGCIATYKNGMLTGINAIKVSDTENTISLSDVDTQNADTVKAFLWDRTLTPVTKALILK